MELEPDRYLGANVDLKYITDTVKKQRVLDFSDPSMTKEVVENFCTKVKDEMTVTKAKAKKLKSYSETVDELEESEKKLADAETVRNQLLWNRDALEAELSEKALKIITKAYKTVKLEIAQRNAKGSQPPTIASSEPAGGGGTGFSYIADSITGNKRKNAE